MKNYSKIYCILFLFGVLVYFNGLNNKFLLDDYIFLSNPVFSSTKFILSQWNPYREQALGVMDNGANLSYYRPMAHAVLDFCYSAFKSHFLEYHLFNLFFFVLASSLIYLLIERITGNCRWAFLAGLFYLIHPINGIMVNYISGCVFTFQVICTLSTVLLVLGSLERKNDRGLYFLSLLFSFSALFWNESGVMTPFYVSAVILLFRKDPLKEKAFYLFPYFFIVVFYIIFRFLFIGINDGILTQTSFFHMTGWEYLASLFQVLAWYTSKLFYPQGIVMQWATPVVHGHIIGNVLGLFLWCMLLILFFVKCAKERILQMAIIWIVIGFAPVCLAAFRIPENGAQIEPHWFVISSIGFFILAAYACIFVLDRFRKIGAVLLFVLIFVWGTVSHANNELWVDQKTYALYWSQQAHALKSTYFYLAEAYQKQGALKESAKYYRLSLAGNDSDFAAYNDLGTIDVSEGHFKSAESNYKKALKIDPYAADPYNNLGDAYLKGGQWEKAESFFYQALAYNPLLLEPRKGLAMIFLNQGEYKKAIDLCQMNLGIISDDTDTLIILIDIYIQEKDFVNIKKYAYRMINDKTDPRVLTNLGVHMAQINAIDIAFDCFTKAIHAAPDYKDAYLAAGTLFANLGKYDKAIHIWELGSGIDPSDQRFRKYIAQAIKEK